MQQKQALQRLQVIADTKSDAALARLAEANRLILGIEEERRALTQRLYQLSLSASGAMDVLALDKYQDWVKLRCLDLDAEHARLQQKAAQLKEIARLDFGKAQAIKKLRAR